MIRNENIYISPIESVLCYRFFENYDEIWSTAHCFDMKKAEWSKIQVSKFFACFPSFPTFFWSILRDENWSLQVLVWSFARALQWAQYYQSFYQVSFELLKYNSSIAAEGKTFPSFLRQWIDSPLGRKFCFLQLWVNSTLFGSDKFQLKFSNLSRAGLKSCQAESSQAGTLYFWARTELLIFLCKTFFL